VADKYWNARGGSSSDGGAFIFTVSADRDGKKLLTCTDKFGRAIMVESGNTRCDTSATEIRQLVDACSPQGTRESVAAKRECGGSLRLRGEPSVLAAGELSQFCRLVFKGDNAKSRATAIELLSLLRDRRFDTVISAGQLLVRVVDDILEALFDSAPLFAEPASRFWRR